jgi:hypothetical protein
MPATAGRSTSTGWSSTADQLLPDVLAGLDGRGISPGAVKLAAVAGCDTKGAGRDSRPALRCYLLLFMVSVRYCCVFAVLKALLPVSLTSVVTVSPFWILTIFMTGVKPSLAKITWSGL